MRCLRIWSVIIPIVMIVVKHDVGLSSKDVVLNGGYIGCLYQEVCLRGEVCYDDSLFGRCVRRDLQGDLWSIGPKHKSKLKSLVLYKQPQEYNWADTTLQCMLRTILLESGSYSITVDPKSFCLYQHDTEDDGGQLYSKYTKRGVREHRGYPNFMFSNPLKTRSPYYFPETFHESTNSDNSYDLWDDTLVNKGINNEMNNEDHFTKQIHQMKLLPANYDGDNNAKFNREQELADKLMEDNSNMATRLYQNDYLLSDNHMQQPQLREISPLEFQTNQPEEMIIPSDPVTRLRSHKMMSGSSKQLERRWVWIKFLNGPISNQVAQSILFKISHDLKLTSPISFFFLDKSRRVLYFRVPSSAGVSADTIVDALNTKINSIDGYSIEDVGFGRGAVNTVNTRSTTDATITSPQPSLLHPSVNDNLFKTAGQIKWERYTMTIVLCSTILAAVLILTTLYLVQICRRKHKLKSESNEKLSCHSDDSSQLESKTYAGNNHRSTSQQSSVSSNSSEPVHCTIDVPTGHLILSYMEKHLRDRSRLEADWNSVDKYVSEDGVLYEEGRSPKNQSKNRENAPIPYEQSRVKLRSGDDDYINASLLYDNNPRNPVYIATITPTIKSIPDFWLMIWEQGCVVIVCLERTDELKRMDEIDQFELNDASVKYWPNEGSQVYGSFEVHLVSEHSWNDHYIVRSLYLKSIITNETRTVTQFHYLTWKDENLKENSKPMLEFRRKVNRSFRGMMSPIVVHCSDGCGRTGAYILLDLVLNRITKSIKEIDIAASLEHLRDQRPNMIKTLEQYEFVLSSTAEEVDAMLQTSS
ncbi:hypothetical protein MN116_004860 [Schistosoma mekongi]|uniref:Receptor-type tyrosine-protein phosphatase N2 n=1 Tax=Schistosoma mekongi TaxID=38744 RepID=A0AAE2D510_SCHME|nr:hypothetical protein MN116_004860 [Schistosoma mekongi]